MVQWLRLCASHAEGTGSIPGLGRPYMPPGVWPIKKKVNKILMRPVH